MALDDGFHVGFDQAVEAALVELGEATPDVSESALPADPAETFLDLDQAELEPQVEQPDSGIVSQEETEEEELFGDIEVPEPQTEPETVSIEELVFELPGVDEPVNLQDLKDGYLRQADYTRKTQALAAEKRQNEDALKFWEALKKEPIQVLTALATEAGILPEGQAPARKVEFSPLHTAEQVEAEIIRRVEEEVARHPQVQEAALYQAEQVIASEFDRIETQYQVKLGPKSRRQILKVASARKVVDLELIFKSLMADRQAKAASAEKLRGAAPSKPTRRVSETPVTEAPADFDDAFGRALAEQGMG